jgi:ADP-ribose pyrophosphatase YjhB (NUDIX family)
VALRRLGYRLASRILALVWVLARVRRAGVKCVITDGDQLLLVRHSYGSRAWDLPGGAGRHGEAAPAIARREMAEELGIDISAWRDIGTLRSVRGRHRVRLLAAEISAPALHVDPVELQAAAWFPRDRLPLWVSPLLSAYLTAQAGQLSGDLTPIQWSRGAWT